VSLFSYHDSAITLLSSLSLHDALPICRFERVGVLQPVFLERDRRHLLREPFTHRRRGHEVEVAFEHVRVEGNLYFVPATTVRERSEEHTSELQPRGQLVCRLLLEKKNE